ncbi:MAG TPA: ABC transporter ATP-binding protein [Candidatus Kapabacteria bacterium]|nr:ABC transporter ATP-binding protein [Candidatus Kapabacteria bacterium]
MAQDEELLGKAYDARLMKRLLRYLRPYWWQVLLAIIATIVVSLLGPYRVELMRQAIESATTEKNFDTITRIALMMTATVLLQAVVQYAQTIVTQWIGQKTIYNFRKEIFAHLQQLSLRFYDKNPVGRLVTRLTSDVEVLNELFSSGIVMIFADVFVIVWIWIFMFSTSWQLSLMMLVVFPFLLVATAIFRKKARESYREVRVLIAKISAYLNERVSGIITVQLFGREKRTAEEFDKINYDHADANIRSVFYYAVFFPIVDLLSATSFALIVYYGGSQIIDLPPNIKPSITIATMIAFFSWVEMFFRPLRDLADKYNILQSAMASSERVFKLLDDQTIIPEAEHPVALGAVGGEIEFKNVTFAYNEGENILKNVSFHVKPGETVAIVGATGAGKTSITNLLTRFYEFQQGEILIDGKDIRTVDAHEVRKNIAIVLQDVFLFSADVLTNITLGDSDISDEQAISAAVTVGADPFIKRLPSGYHTHVKERGAILSVGEKQLLSFARALAYDPRILILDEATSSIDTDSEILIQRAISRLLEDRTSIVIAHRLSTIQKADKIIVMHHGEIREMGTHNELLALNGIYRTLYELQYKEQEISLAA